ncbi:MAG: hypothetical protein DHS20C16_08560 [Phycisphaerae bacterium]|nr:MAG: hypothetical protein DHS20C16_08560 [Phycisphaerae bacterium]
MERDDTLEIQALPQSSDMSDGTMYHVRTIQANHRSLPWIPLIHHDLGSTVICVPRFDDNQASRLWRQFPKGTHVRIKKVANSGTGISMVTEVFGKVIAWRYGPTGAWFSRNGDPYILNANGKFQLLRLKLAKVDGEITDIVIDDLTSMTRANAKPAEPDSEIDRPSQRNNT